MTIVCSGSMYIKRESLEHLSCIESWIQGIQGIVPASSQRRSTSCRWDLSDSLSHIEQLLSWKPTESSWVISSWYVGDGYGIGYGNIDVFFSGNSFLFFSILFRNQDVLAKTTEIWSIPTPSNVEIKNINLPKSRK